MANPFELLKAKVSATNDVLKRKKVGVTIYIKNCLLYTSDAADDLYKERCFCS